MKALADGGLPPTTGVKIEEASRITGLTIPQLRWRIRNDLVRHRRAGKFVVIHAEDVHAMAGNLWQGRPFSTGGKEATA